MTMIAGPFSIDYNTNSLGIIEDAIRLETPNITDPIVGDFLGGSTLDGVYRGGNCFLDLVVQEFDSPGALEAFASYNVPAGGVREFGVVGAVGTLMSRYSQSLVLTALPGTTARTEIKGYRYEFYEAVLAPNFPVQMLFGARHRNIPIRFQCLPVLAGTPQVQRWFSITAP